ncbi:MAG: hypothetical protein ABW175_26285 [Bradyrhizobium sp.]
MPDLPFKKTPAQKLAAASEGSAAYHTVERAKHANMLRLRSERLAREAARVPEAVADEKPKQRKRAAKKQPVGTSD